MTPGQALTNGEAELPWWETTDPAQESRPSREVRKIGQSIAYMMRHLDAPVKAATLAAEVNLSPSHFFYLFKYYVGSTPIDYFTRLRLQRARHLLANTEMSVKAIAYTLGYHDPFYFSRVFKRFNQHAPSKYRSLNTEPEKRTAPSFPEQSISTSITVAWSPTIGPLSEKRVKVVTETHSGFTARSGGPAMQIGLSLPVKSRT